MKHKFYSIYDSKVEAFMPPFLMRNKGEAIRAFGQTVNDPKSNLCQWPADFTLFEIGEFDEYTGQINGYDIKLALGTALEHKRSEPIQDMKTLGLRANEPMKQVKQ